MAEAVQQGQTHLTSAHLEVDVVPDAARVASCETVDAAEVSDAFVKAVPIRFARRFGVLGLEPEDGVVPVAVASMDALHAVDKVAVLLGMPTRPVLVDESELMAGIVGW